MNILYVCSDFGIPIFGIKGASVHMRSLARGFSKNGDRVVLISPRLELPEGADPDFPAVELSPGPEADPVFRDLRAVGKFLGEKNRISNEVRSILYNRVLEDWLRDYLKDHSVDFILERYSLFSFSALTVAKEMGIPFILEVNAILTREQQTMRGLHLADIAQKIEDKLFRESDAILTVSDWLKEYIVSRQADSSKIRVLPNGIDPELFKTTADETNEFRHQFRCRNNFLIGFSGSLKPWHGVELLVEAMPEILRRIPEARAVIIGDGPLNEKLRQLANELGVAKNVIFTGRVQHETISRYLTALDVAVAPYLPRQDFYFSPIKIFEYMAAGAPILTTLQGQIPQILRDGETGLFFTPGDRADFVNQIERLYNDPALRRRLSEKGKREVFSKYTWKKNAERIVELANTLTGSGNP